MWSYNYDAFGKSTNVAHDPTNKKTFTGKESDEDSGLYYFLARYYDPATGRFLSTDPIPHINNYVYCDSNPINKDDPDGRIGIMTNPENSKYYSGLSMTAGIVAAGTTELPPIAICSGIISIGAGIMSILTAENPEAVMQGFEMGLIEGATKIFKLSAKSNAAGYIAYDKATEAIQKYNKQELDKRHKAKKADYKEKYGSDAILRETPEINQNEVSPSIPSFDDTYENFKDNEDAKKIIKNSSPKDTERNK